MRKRLDNRKRCVVRVLVEMLAPYNGRVYNPCCGSAGMFVQSEKLVEEHGGRNGDIAVYGQESNSTTRRLSSRRSQRSSLTMKANNLEYRHTFRFALFCAAIAKTIELPRLRRKNYCPI